MVGVVDRDMPLDGEDDPEPATGRHGHERPGPMQAVLLVQFEGQRCTVERGALDSEPGVEREERAVRPPRLVVGVAHHVVGEIEGRVVLQVDRDGALRLARRVVVGNVVVDGAMEIGVDLVGIVVRDGDHHVVAVGRRVQTSAGIEAVEEGLLGRIRGPDPQMPTVDGGSERLADEAWTGQADARQSFERLAGDPLEEVGRVRRPWGTARTDPGARSRPRCRGRSARRARRCRPAR